jgi:hypothetical protein
VDDADIARMNAFWGDQSWRDVAYGPVQTLFGPEDEKTDNKTIAEAFRKRLRDVAGFKNVPNQFRCETPSAEQSITSSSLHKSLSPRTSLPTSSPSTKIGE